MKGWLLPLAVRLPLNIVSINDEILVKEKKDKPS
jgi:hypothetical protein